VYLVSFTAPVSIAFSKSAGGVSVDFNPGTTYVLSAAQYHFLAKHEVKAAFGREAQAESRLRPFLAAPYGGSGSLLFYAGAGGYGDQLMALPAAKYLADLGYTVTALVDPGNEQCWGHQPWLRGTLVVPTPKTVFDGFAHHALAEVVSNLDEFPDQRHPVDVLLHRFGVDPATVPAERKAVAPVVTDAEAQAAASFVGDRRIALYQMGGSGHARRLSPTASRALFLALANAFPDLFWVGLFDRHCPEGYYAPLPSDAPVNCQLLSFPGLRPLFAVAQRAIVGVGIDSLLVHLMGSLGRPMVGLWGATPPGLRVAYYKNHLPLWHRTACPQSPCLRYRPTLERCPSEARQHDQCLCLHDIDASEVIAAVRVAKS
jgi:ADP-heptose:LPS heptosyltransferase